jgi:hypothetical protein
MYAKLTLILGTVMLMVSLHYLIPEGNWLCLLGLATSPMFIASAFLELRTTDEA